LEGPGYFQTRTSGQRPFLQASQPTAKEKEEKEKEEKKQPPARGYY